MKCTNCGKEIKIAECVYNNAAAYGNLVLGKSECCGVGYLVKRKISFSVTPYTGDKTEDDWGEGLVKANAL